MAVAAITPTALRDQVESPQLIRKPLQQIVLQAPLTVPVPDLATGFIDATDPTKLSIDLTQWKVFGTVASEGVSEKVKTTDDAAEDFNDMESPRKDVTGVERTLDITVMDDHTRAYFENIFAQSFAGINPATDKVLAFDSSSIPVFPIKRLLSISWDFLDGDQSKPIFDIDCYTRAQQGDLPANEKKKKGYPESTVAFNLYRDKTYGTYCRRWRGGAGYDLETFGF